MATSKKAAPKAAPVVEEEEEGVEVEGEGGEDLVIDLNETEEQGEYPTLPRGTYNCEIGNVEFGYSQASGNPMWTLTLEVTDDGYESHKLFTHLVWAGKGLPRTKTACTTIFADVIEDLSQVKPRELAESGELVGIKCRARVDIRMYEGSKRNNVKNLLPAEED